MCVRMYGFLPIKNEFLALENTISILIITAHFVESITGVVNTHSQKKHFNRYSKQNNHTLLAV